MQMLTFGASFKTAPVSVREKISFSGVELENALIKLSLYDGIEEVVILSTCNRTEFYIITKDLDIARESLISFLEHEKNICFKDIEDNFYHYYNKFAAEHLYRVAAGIESLVIGENEILCQIKTAFFAALEAGSTSKILNSLFKFVIETGKKVRTETTISKRPTSIGSVTANLAKDNFGDDLKHKTVLLLGAGTISKVTAKNLKSNGVEKLIILNRTFEKAKSLADELNGTALEFSELNNVLNKADIVIVCTGAPDYLVSKDNFKSEKPVLLIDLSIPRNIDPKLSEYENIKLYDIDSLEQVISVNKEERKLLIKEVETILLQEMNRFVEWYNTLEVSPVISSLSSFFDEVRNNEISRALRKYKFDDEQKKVIDIVTKSIVQKILHYPATNLRLEEDNELKKQYAEDLTYLFQLNPDDGYQKYFRKKSSEIVKKDNVINHEKLKSNVTEPVCPAGFGLNKAVVESKTPEKARCPFANM